MRVVFERMRNGGWASSGESTTNPPRFFVCILSGQSQLSSFFFGFAWYETRTAPVGVSCEKSDCGKFVLACPPPSPRREWWARSGTELSR